MKTVVLDQALSTAEVVGVARHGWTVQVAPAAIARVQASRDRVDAALARGVPIYGINTGFGSLSRMRIGDDQLRDLQSNLVRSHAAGICDPLPNDVVRAMLVVLAASLCRGLSGVRPEVIESVVAMLNAGITPVVPSVGSVGASGDLAPLAHAALVLIGEGEAIYQNERIPGGRALQLAGLQAIELAPKEGLALLNGTHLMAGELALLVERSSLVFDAAVLSTACSIDACRASHGFLDPRLYKARGHHGPVACAQALAQLLLGSEIVESHRENDPRVQDPYSMRCSAIVLGSVADLLGSVRTRVDQELQAVSDNPLVFDDGAIVSGGNFHGMPVAIPLDTLAIGLAHLAGIAERRVYHMVSAFDEQAHLRPFLSPTPGLNSGYMVAQYSAAAACNELVHLAAPASVYNLSTCAGMEDYNSFGPRSAAKARRAVDLVQRVIAIELVCSSQAMEAHRPLRSGQGVEAVVSIVRTKVPVLEADRPPSPEIEAVAQMIDDGLFHGLVEGRLW